MIACILTATFFFGNKGIRFLFPYVDTDILNMRNYKKILAEKGFSEGEETIVRGVAYNSGQGCEYGSENCYFVIDVDNIPIFITYNYSNKNFCENKQVGFEGTKVKNGDYVEVFGKYYETGRISTCDSSDYRILILQPGQ